LRIFAMDLLHEPATGTEHRRSDVGKPRVFGLLFTATFGNNTCGTLPPVPKSTCTPLQFGVGE
jgi:hypothetical protein